MTASGFFVSRQHGILGATHPACTASGDLVVLGCGTLGRLTNCEILQRALVVSDCTSGFDGCGPMPGIFNTVTRPGAAAQGGVLCCK